MAAAQMPPQASADLLYKGIRQRLGPAFDVNPRKVGSGGTSRVYAARSRATGTIVAVKVFREPVSCVEWLVQVTDTARTLAAARQLFACARAPAAEGFP